jgi:hypothetical protein
MIMDSVSNDANTQDLQAKSQVESKKNEENQLAAKALNDFNALVSKLTQ